jgi:hypothetical protein
LAVADRGAPWLVPATTGFLVENQGQIGFRFGHRKGVKARVFSTRDVRHLVAAREAITPKRGVYTARALAESASMIDRRAQVFGGVLAAMVACSAVPPRAHAAGASEVEPLIRRGIELRHDGQDVQALPFFQKAYEADRTPRTAGQLGLCELAVGYWLDAEVHLNEALASAEHPWVKRNLPSLRGALETARGNLGEVEVSATPPSGDVFIDHRKVGSLPLARPLRLEKGPHDLEVRADGRTVVKSVVVAGGATQVVTFDLAPTAPPPAAPPPLASQPPGELVGQAAEPSVAVAAVADARGEDAATSGGPRRVAAWVTGGVAVAALGLGVFETVRWSDQRQAFDAHTGPLMRAPGQTGPNCGLDEPNYGGAGCSAIYDSMSQARVLTFVGYGAAIVAGAGAAYLFAGSHGSSKSSTQVVLACAPSLLAPGGSCRLNF